MFLPSPRSEGNFHCIHGNGSNDDNQRIVGWKVNIHDSMVWDAFTPVDTVVEPDKYTVTEYMPVESGWFAATPTSVDVTLAANDDQAVTFGNYCKFQGVGARTIGYWKTHQAATTALLPVTLGSTTVSTWNQAYNILNGADSKDAMVMLKAQLLGALLNVKQDPALGNAYIAGANKTVLLLPHSVRHC
jgi:hypothetical protein